MDAPPKKRRFWQLHLSTAVILMFAWGSFLFGNFRASSKLPYKEPSPIARQMISNIEDASGIDVPDDSSLFNETHYGWPFEFGIRNTYDGPMKVTRKSGATLEVTISGRHIEFSIKSAPNMRSSGEFALMAPPPLELWALLADILVCALILAFVAFISESVIRRREGRKP